MPPWKLEYTFQRFKEVKKSVHLVLQLVSLMFNWLGAILTQLELLLARPNFCKLN